MPVLLEVFGIPGKLLGLILGAEGRELARIGSLLTVPAGQVLTVEQGDEAGAGSLVVGPRRGPGSLTGRSGKGPGKPGTALTLLQGNIS